MKDKVVPNNSYVKDKKTEVEDHPRISSISNKTKFVTASNDSLKSRTSNVNAVCATCGKCVFNSNHDACVSKYLNDVNDRTKKPKLVPFSTRKPKSQANKSVATPPKKTERISKKRTKNEAKTTKPDTEWKSRKKTKSKSKPKYRKVNPDKPEAKKSRKTSLGTKLVKSLILFKEEKEENKEEG
ncbi:hypothetical protein Tco_1453453 [Tanacetum coccineum]